MDSIWLWPLALFAFLLAWPALRALALRVLGRRLREQALAAQPERISLVRVAQVRWRSETARESAERELADAGFVEAGTYTVTEMPGLSLALYAQPAQCAYAILYDHPRSDFWVEFVTRYADGSIATYTTLEPMHVELPENSVHVAAPELTPGGLWRKMLLERPDRGMLPCDRSSAARDFERGYAESVAAHKSRHAPEPQDDDDDLELKQAA